MSNYEATITATADEMLAGDDELDLDSANVDLVEVLRSHADTHLRLLPDEDGEDFLSGDDVEIDDLPAAYWRGETEQIAGMIAADPAPFAAYIAAGRTSVDLGHDIFLTREGHGTGVWDRGLGDLGDVLRDKFRSLGDAGHVWIESDADGNAVAHYDG